MKKLLKGALTIGVVAILAFGASQAYFSDTEVSTGNSFVAGAIDLKIDNHSWYFGPEGLVYRGDLSWEATDLDGHLFFDYNLDLYGMQPNTEYHLHYYADPWNSPNGIAIDTFTTDTNGDFSGSGSVDLGTDLPVIGDANYPNAKIWIIPTSHWGGTGVGMITWDATQYLWEWNLVTYDDTDAP